MKDLRAIADGVRIRDKVSVARALNLIEDRRREVEREVRELLSLLGQGTDEQRGRRVGLTGPPGVGKSSLIAALARALRGRGETVGVVAVDPSSVRSGGALLGDRARMAFDPADEGLFVRSLATQGALGGLSHATHAAVEVLGAAYDVVLVETVGVGQSETRVVDVAESVVLVVQPGSGDVLQFLKAGVMEIPDLLVVNKSDHGATATRAAGELKAALSAIRQVGAGQGDRAVLLASASTGSGIDELVAALDHHRAGLGAEGVAVRRREGRISWACEWLERRAGTLGLEVLGGAAVVRAELAARVTSGEPPLAAAQALAEQLLVSRM